MILVSVDSVVKRFGAVSVLDGASFDVRAGERIGLVGPNGTGKTTLLKIIASDEDADRGEVNRHPNARVGYQKQQPDFADHQTVWQVAMEALGDLVELSRQAELLGEKIARASDARQRQQFSEQFDRLQTELAQRDGYHLNHRVERVLDGLKFSRDAYQQPVGQLSGGQQRRLLLAQLLLSAPDLLLLDEPSNHLDLESTQWLETFLDQSRQAWIVVSHDRFFLDRVTNRTLELYHGTIDSYKGNFSAYWRQKAERVEFQRRTYERQQTEIAKAKEFIRRHSYGQKHAQAEDRRKKLERIEPVAPPREIVVPPMGFPKVERCGDVVLRVERLAKSFDVPLFDDLSFTIQRGERWGILGGNATGKTTLLRCIVGQQKPDTGAAILGTGVVPGYYEQQLVEMSAETAVVDAIRPSRVDTTEPERRNLLARFGITGDVVFQPVESLSGGERSRAALARLAAEQVNFLILDEPTNHLDLWARDALERSLREFDGTALLVSHDRYFLNCVVDHLMVVENGRFRVIHGNYDTYQHLASRAQLSGVSGADPNSESDGAVAAADGTARRKSWQRNADRGRRKRRFPYRKVAEIEAEIFERETAVESLHSQLTDPDVLRDGSRIKTIQAEISAHQETLATLYEHWEEASELNA